ncbi:hypothetical protein SAMN05660649_04763, partial [Desulfotomaculum arcticum]
CYVFSLPKNNIAKLASAEAFLKTLLSQVFIRVISDTRDRRAANSETPS